MKGKILSGVLKYFLMAAQLSRLGLGKVRITLYILYLYCYVSKSFYSTITTILYTIVYLDHLYSKSFYILKVKEIGSKRS